MKTSKIILLATAAFFFILTFATFFEMKAAMKDFEIAEIKINHLDEFSAVVVKSNSSVTLTKSNKNELISNAGLESVKISNDTLYIDSEENIEINFKSINSVSSINKGYLSISGLTTVEFKMLLSNSSHIIMRNAEIEKLSIISEESYISVAGNINKLSGNLTNGSVLRINANVSSLNIDSDEESAFFKY
jgi:hypothetical protein